MKKIVSIVVACFLVLMSANSLASAASQTVVSSQPLSSGVNLNKYIYKGTYSNNINHIAIDLNDSFTKVDLGLPGSFAGRSSTTNMANRDSGEGNRVVGAINGSFFHMDNGFPIYLISKNNQIYYGGMISDSYDAYVSKPIAFGVTKDGLAEIDTFDFDITLNHSGKSYEITGVNRTREANEAILFTPQNNTSTTNSNQYGVQYLVTTDSPITSTQFGQTIVGKVSKVYPYGVSAKVEIPKNGFVISANGDKSTELGSIQVGDEISVSMTIDQKWQDSQFMVASGPMLVRDGKRDITMNINSSRATERTARSAIAISADKSKVHFITVDKTSSSKGMTLVEFANYIVSLGYDRAINMDGGGSTTMGYRDYGSNNVVLANTPAYGSQRAISTIFEAVSTAPTSEASSIKFTRSKVGTLLAGTGSQVTVQYILDKYYNPLTIDASKLALVSENKTLKVNGMTFVSTKAANDRIFITYNGKTLQSFPVTVVDAPATMTVSGSKQVAAGSSATYTVTAKDASGAALVYDASMVKWSVEGNIGTITSSGKFTASKAGKGSIVAKLGTKTVSYPIEVQGKGLFSDVTTSHPYYNEITYLAENQYITGYEDGTFKPDAEITRAHGAVILARVLKLDLDNVVNPNFKDVPVTHEYYKQIAAAQNAGIISGKEGGVFDPNGKLTRAQMAKIIAEAFDLTGISSKQFSDVSTGNWAYSYVQALANNGVTTGYEDGTFKPNDHITRAHFGLFIYRSLK